ncbi:hypothetical protein DAEQUDRAFT_370239 [Daedalea quercina L-15889]|uniref:Uncharacterized protein n=1 Tax=Daedalea quercina L-15889 TaxID=1314783 RepID=A0A165PAZ5_9APHY|nr:hypothetical protein DAEQUDRAFT_370239 [Daedalea quercina L-15889]
MGGERLVPRVRRSGERCRGMRVGDLSGEGRGGRLRGVSRGGRGWDGWSWERRVGRMRPRRREEGVRQAHDRCCPGARSRLPGAPVERARDLPEKGSAGTRQWARATVQRDSLPCTCRGGPGRGSARGLKCWASRFPPACSLVGAPSIEPPSSSPRPPTPPPANAPAAQVPRTRSRPRAWLPLSPNRLPRGSRIISLPRCCPAVARTVLDSTFHGLLSVFEAASPLPLLRLLLFLPLPYCTFSRA